MDALKNDWIDNPVTRWLASPRQVDDYLEFFNPLWRRSERRARVLAVKHHNADVVSLTLEPGRGWQQGFAGQHVMLGVDIGGVRHERCFSLSSTLAGQAPEITVKRNGQGLVSNHLVDAVKPGELVWLGDAGGDFVLPWPRPACLLFIAGGSGITPLMAMARQLHAEGWLGELLFLNFTKSEQSFIFRGELEQLQRDLCGLRLVHILTGKDGQHCSTDMLRDRMLSPEQYEAYVCGPDAMMRAVAPLLTEVGVKRVHQERFTLAPAVALPGDGLVHFERGQVDAAGDSAGSLLEVAEKAGLSPRYGCRMGICHSCTCKVTGSIRDQRNGVVRTVDGEDIQICVHAAAGAVSVDA